MIVRAQAPRYRLAIALCVLALWPCQSELRAQEQKPSSKPKVLTKKPVHLARQRLQAGDSCKLKWSTSTALTVRAVVDGKIQRELRKTLLSEHRTMTIGLMKKGFVETLDLEFLDRKLVLEPKTHEDHGLKLVGQKLRLAWQGDALSIHKATKSKDKTMAAWTALKESQRQRLETAEIPSFYWLEKTPCQHLPARTIKVGETFKGNEALLWGLICVTDQSLKWQSCQLQYRGQRDRGGRKLALFNVTVKGSLTGAKRGTKIDFEGQGQLTVDAQWTLPVASQMTLKSSVKILNPMAKGRYQEVTRALMQSRQSVEWTLAKRGKKATKKASKKTEEKAPEKSKEQAQ